MMSKEESAAFWRAGEDEKPMSKSFEGWVSGTPRYCEPTWKDCEEAYLAGAASAEQRVKELNEVVSHSARWINDLEKQVDDLEQELEGQKKANGFLVIERDRACEQHHEVARKLFEVEPRGKYLEAVNESLLTQCREYGKQSDETR